MEKPNIKWYEDEELTIGFNEAPHVCVRYILPSSTPAEVKSIKKYPFINKTAFKVTLFDHKNSKKYEFTVPKCYCWNGSDIPRIFWRIVSSRHEPQYLIASCLHDFILENKSIIDNNRRLSSKVFRAVLIGSGVGAVKANIMMEAVDLFQRCCKW